MQTACAKRAARGIINKRTKGAGHINRNTLRRILILAAAAMLCLVMVRVSYGGRRQGTGSLTLWFSLADCPQDAMEKLLARCFEETGIRVAATAFENEQALGAAFEEGKPDLLFCSHVRAANLGGGLARLKSPLPVPAELEDLGPAPGVSFIPVGSRLVLLLVNTAKADATFENLEALLDAADTDTPTLAGDCWAELLYSACASLGEQVRGDMAEDAKNETWAALYNRLAMAAFKGGLVSRESAAQYVLQGVVPCAAARSTELAALPKNDRGLRLLPLPLPAGGETRYPAQLMGFVLLEGADADAAERFSAWLWQGPRIELASDAGLVQISSADSAEGKSTPLTVLLAELQKAGALVWPGAEEPFFQSREAAEREIRAALDLLN